MIYHLNFYSILQNVKRLTHVNQKKKFKKCIFKGIELRDVIDTQEKFDFIIQVLRLRKYISQDELYWIDFHNGHKKAIIIFLKSLHLKGYCKSNNNITNKQVQEIAWNTLRVKINLNYIKHFDINAHDFKDLPFASTVDFQT